MKSVSVLLVALLASFSAFAFNANQTSAEISAEVATRKQQGQTPEQIADAAASAGLSATALQSVSTALASNFPNLPANSPAMGTLATAITSALGSTASGSGGTGGGGGGGSFQGFAGLSGQSQSRSSSIGGTGTSTCVSPCSR